MSSNFKAISIGELLIDFVSTTIDVPLGECPGFHKAPGGAPANVAVGLAKLGAKAGFIGKVGDDPFGRFLRKTLVENGVEVEGLIFDDYARTTLAFVANRSDGRKEIIFYRNPGADIRLRPEEIDEGYVASADLLHFGSVSLSHSPSREATIRAVEIARDSGAMISYDPNLRLALWDRAEDARQWIWELMPMADVAKLAEEEWEFITGTDDLESGSRRILEMGVKLVVVTRGERGCYFNNGKVQGYLDGFKVDVVDPLGAGDGFVAAMLYAIMERDLGSRLDDLDEDDLREVMAFANAAGALATQQVGVIPSLPTKREIEAFLKTHSIVRANLV
ncbi:carbohydrate kinase [Candidatus Poribacteria bacterium]|nr:carbohydrate kinase [Candidatus Poribacteria bacterium]